MVRTTVGFCYPHADRTASVHALLRLCSQALALARDRLQGLSTPATACAHVHAGIPIAVCNAHKACHACHQPF